MTFNTKVTVTWSVQHYGPKSENIQLCLAVLPNMFWIDMFTDRWNQQYDYKEIM